MSSRMALGLVLRRRGERRRPPCASRRTGSPARAPDREGSSRSARSSSTTRMQRAAGRQVIAVVVHRRARPVGAAVRAGGRWRPIDRVAAAEPDGCGVAGRRRWRSPSSARYTQRQREREHAAGAGTALDGDIAAEQARQVAGDRQAEAGAAELAVRAAIRLAERFEDDGLLVRGNADAGVAHGKRHDAGRSRRTRAATLRRAR